jgi:hypothetical protein
MHRQMSGLRGRIGRAGEREKAKYQESNCGKSRRKQSVLKRRQEARVIASVPGMGRRGRSMSNKLARRKKV